MSFPKVDPAEASLWLVRFNYHFPRMNFNAKLICVSRTASSHSAQTLAQLYVDSRGTSSCQLKPQHRSPPRAGVMHQGGQVAALPVSGQMWLHREPSAGAQCSVRSLQMTKKPVSGTCWPLRLPSRGGHRDRRWSGFQRLGDGGDQCCSRSWGLLER